MLTTEAADAAETTMEIAPGTLHVAGKRYTGALLIFEERFKSKYAVGFGLTTAWDCADQNDCRRGNGPNNQFVYAQRIITKNKFELGLGVSYWSNKTPAWNSHTPFALSLGYNFTDHLNIKLRHFSTAGSSTSNGGLDMISLGWRF